MKRQSSFQLFSPIQGRPFAIGGRVAISLLAHASVPMGLVRFVDIKDTFSTLARLFSSEFSRLLYGEWAIADYSALTVWVHNQSLFIVLLISFCVEPLLVLNFQEFLYRGAFTSAWHRCQWVLWFDLYQGHLSVSIETWWW